MCVCVCVCVCVLSYSQIYIVSKITLLGFYVNNTKTTSLNKHKLSTKGYSQQKTKHIFIHIFSSLMNTINIIIHL